MKHTFTRLTLFILFLFTITQSNASHLMGGNLGYTYQGLQSNGKYRYTVTLQLYRFCGTATPSPSPLPQDMELGVYNQDPANPNADKILITNGNYTVPKISQQFISPPSPNDSCTFTANACVEQGIYQIIIDVPPSASGYHLIMDRCCRNGNVQNLLNPSGQGEAWYAFIPPTSIVNNSPTFAVPPIPFLCAADTASVLNAAFDSDGDLLIYHFVTPISGLSNTGSATPPLPATYTWPIPPASYDAGYSFTQPFGAGGYASIDSLTGLTSYLSPNQGYFVVAVEITEYRNGILVGITRLDFQLILVNCPINPAPIPNSGGLTVFSIQEGHTICFPIVFHDLNADSLSTTHQGPIFNNPPTNPPATITDAVGDSVVTSQFCWTTSCNQGSSTYYQFTVTCADNGCPAKTTSQVYTINVVPFTGTTILNGPDTLCSTALTGVTFSTSGIATSTYNWTITNGTQVTGANTNFISVDFGPTGPYSVTVREVNAIGCEGNPVTKNVIAIAAPTSNAGADPSFCSGLSATLGTASTPNYNYSWAPATGLSSTTVSNPTVTLSNGGGSPTSTTYIVTTTEGACVSKDTVVATVNPLPISNAGNNQFLCSGNSLIIGTTFTGGYTYQWTPSGGLSSTTVSNPTVTLTNNTGVADTTIYSVLTTNAYQCTSSDNVLVIVNVLPNVQATAAPATICPGTPATLTATGANTYSWALLTAPGTPIGNAATLSVNPTTQTSYIVTGNSASNCTYKDTITLNVFAAPIITATQSIDSICPNDSVHLAATGGASYTWATQAASTVVIGSNQTLDVHPLTTTNYIVTGTDGNGCISKDTITVHVNAAPVSNAGVNQSLCSASTINLGTGSTTGNTYQWSPSTGLSGTTISNPTTTLSNTGNTPDTLIYTVLTTNAAGCTSSDDVTIIVNPVPTANAGNDGIICSGQSVQVGSAATSGYTYLWNPSTGLVGPTTSNPTATLTNVTSVFDTVHYIVTTTWFGCIDKDTVDVIVKPNPVSNAGNDQNLCSGNTIPLGTTSTTGYNYGWSPATGLSSTTASNPNVTLTGTTTSTNTYIVTTTWNGCITQDSVTITLNPLPTVTSTANPAAICLGTSATLTATGAANYSWALLTNPGTPVSTANPYSVSPTVSTSYIVTGTTAALCSSKDTINIQVNPLPSVTATAPNDSICLGDSIILTGNGAVNYTWQILGGATISSNSTVQVQPIVATSYILTGTDAIGCENKDTIEITVNPTPTITATGGTVSVCPGVLGVPYWVNSPNSNSTYQWTITGGTVASGQGQDTVLVNWGLAGSGVVSVIEITDRGCASGPIDLQVNINAILTPVAPTGTPTICANDGAGLIYSIIGTPMSSYTWHVFGGTVVSGNGTNTVTVDWNAAGPSIGYVWYDESSLTPDTNCFGVSDTFQVVINPAPNTSAITGASALCVFDSIPLSVINTAGSTYQWGLTSGTVLSGNGSNSIYAGFNAAGAITATVVETNSYGCVGDSINYNITVNALPVVTASATPAAICIGSSTTLQATGGTNYTWSPVAGLNDPSVSNPTANPTTTTTYSVLVTDANGCSNTNSTTITVNALPVVTTSATASAICIGQTTSTLSVTGGTTWAWSPTAGLNNPSISNPTANPTVNTTYTVTATDVNGCSATNSISIVANALPTIVASNDTSVCNGSGVAINATGGVSYVWSPSTGLSSATVASPIATPLNPTTYTVTGTDANGCTNFDDVTISFAAQPNSEFTTDSVAASCGGITVYFYADDQNANSYLWNFGDGKTSTDVNPVHVYNFASSVNVVLIVKSGNCFDTTSTPLQLLSLADYVKNAPNVFTPNGDGKNDCYEFKGLGDFRACSTIKIFDRWGKEVFSTSDADKCWDGKGKSGNECPVGSYFYIVDVSGFQLHGTVELLR